MMGKALSMADHQETSVLHALARRGLVPVIGKLALSFV